MVKTLIDDRLTKKEVHFR